MNIYFLKVYLVCIATLVISSCQDKIDTTIEDVKNESVEENTCQFNDYDKLILSSVSQTNFQHPYPDFISRLESRYGKQNNLLNPELSIISIDTIERGRKLSLEFYVLNEEVILIDRNVYLTDKLNSYVSDSVATRELYYISSTCCVREQFSRGCANISRTTAENSLCEKVIKNFFHITDEKQ